ncbi:glycosyltransferase family 2 protein [Aminipila luticellarii]|nr:glycosyltransferase family 2 protein [Aminipila luticellarii]
MTRKNDIVLSIGLIVKNEEENLARCLDSLKPLMETIPCQLIITDTGSADSTVEIAKRYTDEVYEFEWCDDFAAARNAGLKKAKGQWFMFIDGDEWFEDCQDLIDFFQSGEYKEYKNATYIVRNYVNKKDKSNYEDQHLGRLYKIRKGMAFQGSIHEYISLELPIKELHSYANHYGYSTDNSKEHKQIKHQRNLSLLIKEYQKDPDNCRLAYLLAKQYAAGKDKKSYRNLIREFYEKHQEDWENEYLPYFTYQTALICKEEGNPEQGAEILKKYKKNRKEAEVWDLDILAALSDTCFSAGKFKAAIKYAKEYFKLFSAFQKGDVPTGISGITTQPTFVNEESTITLYNVMLKSYIKLEEYEQAMNIIQHLDWNIMILEDLNISLHLLFHMVFTRSQWMLLPDIYSRLLQTGQQGKSQLFVELLEKKIVEYLSAYEALAKEFACNENLRKDFPEDNYVLLQKLRWSMVLSDNESKSIADRFLEKNKGARVEPVFAEFVLFALANPTYRDLVLDKIDLEDLHLYTHKVVSLYSNLHELFIYLFSGWNGLRMTGSRRFNYWIICFMEIILLSNAKVEKSTKSELTDIYVEKAHEYMTQLYNHAVLCEEQIYLLPRSYRFIYYMYEAKKAVVEGNRHDYVKQLKKAVAVYPIMGGVVDSLVNTMEEKFEKEPSNKSEFDFYAESVKRKIKEIAKEERLRDEAIKLLDAYKKINPKDEEGIAELRLLLRIDN